MIPNPYQAVSSVWADEEPVHDAGEVQRFYVEIDVERKDRSTVQLIAAIGRALRSVDGFHDADIQSSFGGRDPEGEFPL